MRELNIPQVASLGRYGDTIIAHISSKEARVLKDRGGAGTVNPRTGMKEFYESDGGESAGMGGDGASSSGTGHGGGGESAGMGGEGESGGGVGHEGGGESAGMGDGRSASPDSDADGGYYSSLTGLPVEKGPAKTITLSSGQTATWDGSTGTYKLELGSTSTIGGLLRAQFAEWEKVYKPIELSAINKLSFNNPQVLDDAVREATQAASGSADAFAGILGRQTRAMGQNPTGEQRAVSGRVLDLNRAAATASAANVARENIRTQDEQILLGGAPNPNIVKSS